MRESSLMKLQYATGLVALVLVAIHLLMQGVLVPYGEALSFQGVLAVYRNAVDASLLEILLVVILAHGFNGLRVILLEWRQGAGWTRGVNLGVLVVAVAVAAYGTRTVILAITGAIT